MFCHQQITSNCWLLHILWRRVWNILQLHSWIKIRARYDISCINSTLRRGQHTNARSWYLYCLTSTDCNNTSQRERPERPNRGSVGSTRRHHHHWCRSVGPLPNIVLCSAPSVPQQVFTITEKAPTRAFSWLKAPTSAFTFKTLLRRYAKWALTPRSLNVKLGPRRYYHEGRAAIRHYANQPARPLWLWCQCPNFPSTYRGLTSV